MLVGLLEGVTVRVPVRVLEGVELEVELVVGVYVAVIDPLGVLVGEAVRVLVEVEL